MLKICSKVVKMSDFAQNYGKVGPHNDDPGPPKERKERRFVNSSAFGLLATKPISKASVRQWRLSKVVRTDRKSQKMTRNDEK